MRSIELPTFDPHAETQAVGIGALGQIDIDVGVMHGLPRIGNDLDPLHVAIFGEDPDRPLLRG
jgi:hypothetical protein